MLIRRQCLVALSHRFQIGCHRHPRRAHEFVIRVLRNEGLKSCVRFCESLFTTLSFSEQKISIGACRRVRLTCNYLLIVLCALCARLQGGCRCSLAIGIKAITRKTDDGEQDDNERPDDLILEALPKHECFNRCVARRRWSCRHKLSYVLSRSKQAERRLMPREGLSRKHGKRAVIAT